MGSTFRRPVGQWRADKGHDGRIGRSPEPRSKPAKPPCPREPTTSMSALEASSTRTSAACPSRNDRLSLNSGVAGALDRGVCGLPRKFLERLSTDGGHVAGSAVHGQWDVPRGDEPQARPSETRLVDSPVDRPIAVLGSIHSDNDRFFSGGHELLSRGCLLGRSCQFEDKEACCDSASRTWIKAERPLELRLDAKGGCPAVSIALRGSSSKSPMLPCGSDAASRSRECASRSAPGAGHPPTERRSRRPRGGDRGSHQPEARR